ncbi:MAG: HTTM domain-containing protein, partial [Candidatus Eisenbacteria bacterium]
MSRARSTNPIPPAAGGLGARLFAPVDIASLVFFRIGLGAILVWEVVRYFDHGWIGRYWIRPAFHFTYYGFEWVRPWPGIGMYLHFAALGLLAVGIALGWHYRLCAALFALGFIYVFLLEQAVYLNHFYMLCLLGILLPFLPLHHAWSLDAARNRRL